MFDDFFTRAFGIWPDDSVRNGRKRMDPTISKAQPTEFVTRINDSHVTKIIVGLGAVFVIGIGCLISVSAAIGPPLPVGWDYQAPTAVFGIMSMIALLNVVFPSSKLTIQKKAAPITLAICLMGLTSYALRAAQVSGPRVAELSGLVILPIRYVEWACTTPMLVLLSALMVDAPVNVTVRIIIYDFVTILTGALGLILPFGVRIIMTIIALLVSVLWVVGFGRLLAASYHRANDRESRRRVVFVSMCSLVLACAYPIVYILHAEKVISILAQEYSYAVMDVSAKILLTVVLTNGSFLSSEGFMRQQMRRAAEELVFLNTVVRTIRQPTDAARAAISEVESLVRHLSDKRQRSDTEHGGMDELSEEPATATRADTERSEPVDEPAVLTQRSAVQESSRATGTASGVAISRASSRRQSLPGHDPEAVLATLSSSVTQIKKAIMDAVFFVALQAGVVRVRTSTIRLGRLIRECTKSIRPALLRRGIDLITSVSDRAPVTVEGDAGQMEYVLNLVCTNAVLSAPRGSKVEIEVTEVDPDDSTSGLSSARLTISDIGRRLSTRDFEALSNAEDAGRLARRAAALLSPGREGSQAEYIVAARLLEQQGGSMRLYNLEPGVARHVIELPLGRRAPAPVPRAVQLEAYGGGAVAPVDSRRFDGAGTTSSSRGPLV